MKRSEIAVAILVMASGGLNHPASAAKIIASDKTIVIVRHAEKPQSGLGQLSCKGLNRSLALPAKLLSRYGVPVAIYAPNPAVPLKEEGSGARYPYVRPLATIEPLAIRAGLPVDLEYDINTPPEKLGTRLLASAPGTYIVAWEHRRGKDLARWLVAQGGNPGEVPRWGQEDFDSIYVIHMAEDAQGKRRVIFSHEHEGLDGMPETCDAGPPREKGTSHAY